MNDMSHFNVRLTPERVKFLLETAGARNVSMRVRTSGKMFVYFTYLGKGFVWSLRFGALEWNFAFNVEREFKSANERAA